LSTKLTLPKHELPRLLLVTAAFGLSIVAATIARLRFDPYALRRLTQPPRSMFRADPADFGLIGYQLVNLTTNDGLVLRGRFFPAYHYHGDRADTISSSAAEPKGSVILLHGYAGNHDSLLEYAAWLVTAGYNILAYDQRGCGQSDGERVTLGALEAHDVGAAIAWLIARGEHNIASWGFSMGGTTAILAAAQYTDLLAVITDCAFAKLEEEIESSMLERGYPRFITAPLSRMTAATLTNHLEAQPGDYDAIDAVNQISPRPLLLVHAGADTLVDPSDAHALYNIAGEPRELWITPHSTHTQSYHDYPSEYKQRVLATLERAFDQQTCG
jgi:alpha-beta hydrolase superfamily lysophospholipase